MQQEPDPPEGMEIFRGMRERLARPVTPIKEESWRAAFHDNPLMRREAGLHRPWRSAMLWMIGLGTTGLLGISVVSIIRPEIALRDAHPQDFGTLYLVYAAFYVLFGVSALLCIWFPAKTWAQDADPRRREEIALTAITPRQLIAARTLLWMLPSLILTGLTFVLCLINLIGYLITQRQILPVWGLESSQWMLIAPGTSMSAALAGLCFGNLFQGFLASLVLLGVLTGRVIRGFRPFSAVIGTLLLMIGIGMIVGGLGLLPFLMTPILPSGSAIPYVASVLIGLLVMAAFAQAIYSRLPRRVAKAYGIERQE